MKKILKQLFQKEFILSNLGQFINILALFLQTKLISMYFSKADYGSWSLLMTYATMLSMLPFTALNNALCRYAANYLHRKKEYISSIVLGYSSICLIQAVVFGSLCLSGAINYDFKNYWFIFIIYSYAEIMKASLFSIHVYFRERKNVLICYLMDCAIVLCCMGTMYVSGTISIKNLLIFISFKDFIVVMFLNKGVGFRLNGDIFQEVYKKLFKFSIPIIFWNMFGYLQNVVNKWFLNSNLSTEAVATYTVAIGVAVYIPTFYQTFVTNYFFPILYAQKEKMNIRKYLKYIGIFALPLFAYCLVMQVFGKYLVIIAYDRKYLDVAGYLKYTCFAASLSILADIGLFELFRMELTRKLVVPKIVPGILMTVIGYSLIPQLGFNGAIINYCIGQISYALLSFAVCLRVQSKYVEEGKLRHDCC